ncbi:MAG: NAD(P)-dependent oxidoreductase [Dehalococcoidia bacterium]|nr:NAD(P)-dependent oxidoreductase [Dehalococcoidia bacterium]
MSDDPATPIKGKTILVTGASGFVGSALALELCKNNHVYGLARFTNGAVRRQLQAAGVSIIQKDIRRESLGRLPERFDYVFSELAILYTCDDDPVEAHDVNTYFVGRLMGWCREASGIVLASTGAVYLPGHHMWSEQGMIAPRNTYGLSKYGGEVLGRFLCEQWNIPTCILRYFNPYGVAGGKVTGWARQVAHGEEIAIDRANTAVVTPIHISDCVRYTIEAAHQCQAPAQVINIGGEAAMDQVEIVSSLAGDMGKVPKFRDVSEAPPFWTGDVGLMLRLFGPPKVAIRAGLKKIAREVSAAP